MYKWEPEKIRFMKDASEFSSYHEILGTWLKPYILPQDSVCDAGCGLGYLSLQMAVFARSVTAVDIHDGALQVLRDNLQEKNIGNVKVIHESVFQLVVEEKFDKMVFCFFGSVEEVLSLGRRLCRGDLFMITRNYNHHRFSKDAPRDGRESFDEICRVLCEKGIAFESKEMDIEFGQPFRYLSEVPKFFQMYQQYTDTVGFTRDEMEGMVFQTQRKDFPFYLPKKRKIGLIRIINKEEGEE